jgi:Na+-transporting NADH:ubiquinone oxidoreductase subunit B
MAEANSEKTETQRPGFWDFYLYQKPMMRVVAATLPALAGAVYLFGWRCVAVVAWSVVVGTFFEWLFARRRRPGKVSSAVFVTAVLYALTLPAGVPWTVTAVGMAVGIVFGKEAFGGFGRNVFNPALVGRAFVYVCFPVALTARWPVPWAGFPAGLARWSAQSLDVVTRATPLAAPGDYSLVELLVGNVGGAMGATSSLLVVIGGLYLVATRTANWRIVVSVAAGAVAASLAFNALGAEGVLGPVQTLLSGPLLFGAFFMATDPVSAATTNPGRYIYGGLIGLLTVVIRAFSNFSGGVMFAILFMNTFNPIVDHAVREAQKRLKAARVEPSTQEAGT